MAKILLCAACLLSVNPVWSQELSDEERELAAGHPRPSYEDVEDIDAMAAALRKHLAGHKGYSFSRGWWQWDRLRARYVDGGRVAQNELKILQAVFRALILDWHDKLVARGEGDLFYIFFVTTAPGDKTRRTLGDRVLVRDLHGGGYHGGWGGAARMRIFEELAARGMLTAEEHERFQQIVHQSISARFLDFERGSQKADNHSYGNGGGIALALKLFPDAPQANEARAWLDRIWDGSLADFGDWQEWTYYPYGPIFLHGMLDIAEATGKIDSDRDLVNTVGRRVLGFVHGGGVCGNPNSGSKVRKDRAPLFADPWQVGCYDVEQSPRDGHFWYRMAQHFEDPEYLWAAEQKILGGRPPSGKVPPEYQAAYDGRFAWFVKRGIQPRLPESKASIGLLSPEKHKIPERLYLNNGRAAGKPFAAYFLYDKKSGHLDNVAGQLFEYSLDGAKLLHTSGKYNSIGKGGATGDESLDSLLVMRRVHPFPQHPDGEAGERDFRRRGPSAHDPSLLKAENNEVGDSYGQFAFDHYYGQGSRWVRRTVLTTEGYLIVADEYVGGEVLGEDFAAGPVWHLAVDETPPGVREQNWFDAPAFDHAWWQSEQKRVLLYFHDDGKLKYCSIQQSHSQDVDPNRTTFAYRPIESGRTERFLSVFVHHGTATPADELAASVTTWISPSGDCSASIGPLTATIRSDGSWQVQRRPAAPEKDLGVQLSENPPMQIIARSPPPPAPVTDEFEVRDGFALIESLDAFRAAIKKDGQRIRLKPGVYRAETVDPPMKYKFPHSDRTADQEHVFAVTGSHNHFDLRGVVIETPVSVQSKLTGRAHVADTWHINGTNNIFEGGYFRNVVDRDYPHFQVTENEFEVWGDNNTFLDCTFFIKGSVPYGYTDFYGKGGPNFGRLNKHSFLSVSRAKNTQLIGCQVYLQSFGHCVHLHGANGVLIKDCLLSGALRPTNDIFREKVGRAREYDFHIMYRGKRPIPRDHMIPMTEDGVRAYGGDKNITVVDTTVERMRGCLQLLCDGDVTLENVTVREAGDFGYDVNSGDKGKVMMKSCCSDLAYNPIFNLTRGPLPKDAYYEIAIQNPPEGSNPTPRTSLGTICGDGCAFVLHDATTRPLPPEAAVLRCGGKHGLTNSTVKNFTAVKLVLDERTRDCVVHSVGPVEDHGQGNQVKTITAARDHPLPSYSGFSAAEINAMAEAVRRSRPQMHRGGWDWERLLVRYVDGGRKEAGALSILHAYFLSILDRYDEAAENGEGDNFNLFPGHGAWGSGGRMRIFAELARQGLLTTVEREKFTKIVNQSLKLGFDYPNIERGVNNRPYGMNGGPAIAVSLFPNMPNAAAHRRWLDVLWRELTEYGDTTETNYYPYGPLFLHGLLDMAEGMGKFESERDFLYALARRYLDYVHGGGVRGNPNSGARVIRDRTRTYADPWNAEYYAGAEHVNDGHVWYRFAQHFQDPEFLWASEQVCLGGRPPEGHEMPPEYERAYDRRYAWFAEQGIEPRVPPGQSKIGYYSPLKYKVPERLYLCPSRESGQPFVSFYVYDRNNNYMHCVDDAGGRLYEYAVDGAKFLHTSGKYSSGRAGVGETAYDMLSVLPPDMAFPLDAEGKMSATSDDTWKMASMAVKFGLNCREGPDSNNWFFDDKIGLFRRTDDPGIGYAHGNMDGYWYLNNDYHLKSARMGPFSVPTLVQNLRISGPKGEALLAVFDSVPKNLKVLLTQGEETHELAGEQRRQALTIVDGGRRGGKCLQLNVPPESSITLALAGIDRKFDAQNEYTRVSYDFRGPAGDLVLNEKTRPRYYQSLYNRGGILVRDSLRAENRGNDSFGQFTMRNYYGARSRWTRQTVLTEEGYLVVRDFYEPGPDVDGYQAAPCWLLTAEGEVHGGDRNWFDAPARDYAWWQKQKKRVLLYLHPGEGLAMGQVAHRVSADIGGGGVHNSFAKATIQAGQPQVWLSVLVPFNEGRNAKDVAGRIKTTVNEKGAATANIGDMTVTIAGDGDWSVKR